METPKEQNPCYMDPSQAPNRDPASALQQIIILIVGTRKKASPNFARPSDPEPVLSTYFPISLH